jgi:hypothetical protein
MFFKITRLAEEVLYFRFEELLHRVRLTGV